MDAFIKVNKEAMMRFLKEPQTLAVLCYLSSASSMHEDGIVMPVQRIINATGLPRQIVRTALSKLQKAGTIVIKPYAKGSTIYVANHTTNQLNNQLTNQLNNQLNFDGTDSGSKGSNRRKSKANQLNNQLANQLSNQHSNRIVDNVEEEKAISNDIAEKKFDFRRAMLEAGVSAEVADAWLQVRKAMKAVNTKVAWDKIQAEILRSGFTADECIRVAAENSWRGFKADWMLKLFRTNNNNNFKQNNDEQFDPTQIALRSAIKLAARTDTPLRDILEGRRNG